MKKAFRLKTVLSKLEKAIASFPKAAMFELYERGYRSVFQQLISCIISIRTRDETTIPVSLVLLEKAPDPESLLELPEKELIQLIRQSTFPEPKAKTMKDVARLAMEQYKGN